MDAMPRHDVPPDRKMRPSCARRPYFARGAAPSLPGIWRRQKRAPAPARFRVTGVVAAMNHVRAALAAGVPAAEQAAFRDYVTSTVREVERLCRERGVPPDQLPRQTAAAYRYLKDLDLRHLPLPAAGSAGSGGKVTVPGLTAYAEGVRTRFTELAATPGGPGPGAVAELLDQLAAERDRLDRAAEARQIDLGRLAPPSRRAHQWLGWLAEADNLERHLDALALLRAACQQARGHPARPRPSRDWPLDVDLYPIAPLYRTTARGQSLHGTASQLFVAAPEEVLAALVLAAVGSQDDAHRGAVRAFAQTEEASEVALALELAGAPAPVVTRGRHYDLAQVFARVNAAHFGGRRAAPRLTWSRAHTARKLGHFQPHTDTVMISVTLDDPRVPSYVLDYVMFHELLHRELGVQVVNGRHVAHGSDFRRAERQFPDYQRAVAYLEKHG
jgi:hypothetical protein